jgi:hypothetical protein
MRRAASAFILLLLVSCATPDHVRQPVYSLQLSASDVAEITALVAQRRDILQPVREIRTEGQRHDLATVYTGRWLKIGDQSDYFTVQKRAGRWHIVSPVQRDHLKRIVTVS